jgi:hypothetical protein
MSRLSSIVKSALAQGIPSLTARERANKSLRDHSVGDGFDSSSGAVALVSTGKDTTARLFKKRSVRRLRNYSQYSPVVRAALDIYRDTVARADWQIVPYDLKKPVNTSVEALIEELLNEPNTTGDSYSVIKEKFVEDYLVIGHGAIEKVIRRNGTPYQLWPLDAGKIALVQGWDGTDQTLPRYAEMKDASGSTVKRWLPDQMAMVLVNRPMSYDDLGLSHVETLDLAVRALLEGDDVLLQQVIDRTPGGLLNLGEGVNKPQVDAMRQEIQAVRKAFAIAGGLKDPKFLRFDATEREIKLLDKQLYFKRLVAAIFQLPLAMLGEMVDSSRANTEAMLANSMEGPGALLKRILDLENAKIVRKFGRYKEHNLMLSYPIMSRRDEKQTAEVTQIQTGSGAWLSTNEARRAAGLPAIEQMPAADEILVPTSAGPIPLSVINAQYFDGDKLREPEVQNNGSGKDDGNGESAKDKGDEQRVSET